MLRKISSSMALATNNIRSNLFHTFLSVLGIVIGVGALVVSILSLIDGMERYARAQITETTSLNAIIIYSVRNKRINEVQIRKDTLSVIHYKELRELQRVLTKQVVAYTNAFESGTITIDDSLKPIGINAIALGEHLPATMVIEAGAVLSAKDMDDKAFVMLVNRSLLTVAGIKVPADAIGKTIVFKNQHYTIKRSVGRRPIKCSPTLSPYYAVDRSGTTGKSTRSLL